MAQHFKNDAERAAALKRSYLLLSGIIILIAITIAYTAYKTFIK